MKKSIFIMLSGLFLLLTCFAFSNSVSADTTLPVSGTTGGCNWSIRYDDENYEKLVIEPSNGKSGTFSGWSDIEKKVPNLSEIVHEVYFEKGVILDSSHIDFANWKHLYRVDLSNLNTSKLTDMSDMFRNCEILYIVKLSGIDTSHVTNMSNMFYFCSNLNDGSSASDASDALDLSGFDTSNVTDMSFMFFHSRISSLDLSNFDTSNVTNMSGMFRSMYRLTSLDLSNFDTSNVTDMSWMFYETPLTSLNLSNFNTSNVKDMSFMFGRTNFSSLDLSNFDTSNVKDFYDMFSQAYNLKSLDLSSFDTAKATNMTGLFSYTPDLRTIYASTKFVIGTNCNSNGLFSSFTDTYNLVGGNGTKCDKTIASQHSTAREYARIDTKDQPGLFTCAHENGLKKISGVAASDGKDGTITHYTCSICNLFYKDPAGKTSPLKESELVEHYSPEISYSWDFQNGYAFCYANLTCKNDASHHITETVKIDDSDTDVCKILKEPTCTNTGSREYIAKFKNPNFSDQSIEHELQKLPHEIENMPTIPATCAKPGSIGGTKCSVCGEILTQPNILTVSHIRGEVQRENEVASTCSKEGSYDEVFYCTQCNKCLERVHKTIPKTEHVPGKTETITITQATCTSKGKLKDITYCDVCGAIINKKTKIYDTDKAPHTEVVITPYTAPTCTKEGRTEATRCSVCNMIVKYSKVLPMIDHTYKEENIITKEATCQAHGIYKRTKTCTVCGYSYDVATGLTIPQLDHTPGKVQTEIIKKPTCISSGRLEEKTYCTVCGELIPALSHSKLIVATGHRMQPTSKTSPATLKQDGGYSWKCSNEGCNVRGMHIIYRISKVTLNAKTFTYNAKAQKPSVTVTTRDKKTLSSSHYTVTYKNNTKIGTATATITFKNNYAGTSKLTFTILPKKAALSTVSASKKACTAKWKKVSDIDGYEIITAQNSNFSKSKKSTKAKKSLTSLKISNLSSNKTYYVKIRTYKKAGSKTYYSAWSSVKKVKVK